MQRIFFYAMLSGVSQTTLHWILNCAMLSKEYSDNFAQDFFLSKVVWSLSDNISMGFQLCNFFSGVLRQQWTGFFLMQCCLEPLRQHCIEIWPVQYCPKSIKKTLHGIFSYTNFFEASYSILHSVFSCALLSQQN